MAAKKKAASEGQVEVTLVRKPPTEKLRVVAWSMGLRKLNRTRCYPDRPEIRGMIFAIKDLVEVTQKA